MNGTSPITRNEQDLAAVLNVDAQTIHALAIEDREVTTMFNRAARAKEWQDLSSKIKNVEYALLAAAALTAIAARPLILPVLALLIMANGVNNYWVKPKASDLHLVRADLDDRARQRLIDLAAKDKGPTPG